MNKKSDAEKFSMRRLKKPLLTIIFILINIVVILVTAFSEFGNSEKAAKFEEIKINVWFLLPAIVCFLVAMIAEIYKYVLMLKLEGKNTKMKRNWRIARRTVLLGKYYDNITPAAIGGQPFQIYYMHKNGGLSEGMATTIPIIGMIANQIGFLIIAVFAIFVGGFLINNSTLVATACFGLIFYAFWPVMVMVATFLPKATSEIITIGVKFLAKIHIIKNRENAIKRANAGVLNYVKCIKIILKTKGLFLKTILLSVLFQVLICLIPFFVLTTFGGNVDFFTCFMTTVAVTAAVYFVPTPGNAGAAEGTFYLVFSGLSSGYTFWAMLVWRFFSYYIYIIMGPIIYFFMHLEKKRGIMK